MRIANDDITSDWLHPTQFADLHRARPDHLRGPKALMLAVLDEALRDAMLIRSAHGGRRRRLRDGRVFEFKLHPSPRRLELQRDALSWIFDGRSRELFSFESVCVHLEIDPENLRNRVRGATMASSHRRAAA